ncbi:hypothetical protein BU23DRAFT_574908 [Bimuria novae-zelandiae CBS 107.79]|uniref:Cell wall protein n=1 Tax=Bimuria novae-zelandiae CBS 107.79 TaxID=1447943 RepID=A0A6A5UM72_9PLEO|nr:hypothetical protein BU23DRAFT_574908 [Bimuria novae-zelandiae CBS 107.79]
MQPLFFLTLILPAFAFPAHQARATNTTCEPQQTARLVDGIQRNINYQMDELKSLKTLQYLALTSPTASNTTSNTTSPSSSKSKTNTTTTIFFAQKSTVATLQQQSISARQSNQDLAQKMQSPSALQRGLAQVAVSQNSAKVALRQVRAGDKGMLGEMVKAVEEGVRLNGENLRVAGEGRCGV